MLGCPGEYGMYLDNPPFFRRIPSAVIGNMVPRHDKKRQQNIKKINTQVSVDGQTDERQSFLPGNASIR
jgi:hypothetical protein